MNVIQGKQLINWNRAAICERLAGFQRLVVDLGTGAGDYVYHLAKANPQNLYIGIDAAAEAMAPAAARAAKKPCRGGLTNLIYVVASAEALPMALEGLVDQVTVVLPWGSLRDGLVLGDGPILTELRRICKPGATIEVTLTYSESYEGATMMDRGLPSLNLSSFRVGLSGLYGARGLELRKMATVGNEEIKGIPSVWAKKLAYGRKRAFYQWTARVLR